MNSSSLENAFSRLEDPRREQGQLHKLTDILIVSICAVISGAETWVDIVDFGADKEKWLRSFLELPNGIPSHDTFARVFQLLDPEQLQACFQTWISDISDALEGEIAPHRIPLAPFLQKTRGNLATTKIGQAIQHYAPELWKDTEHATGRIKRKA